jgi:hypothetical protein
MKALEIDQEKANFFSKKKDRKQSSRKPGNIYFVMTCITYGEKFILRPNSSQTSKTKTGNRDSDN